MKTILLIFISLLIITNISYSQRRSAEEQSKFLKEKLTLTDSQFVFVDSVLKDSETKIISLRDSGEMDRDKIMSLRQKTNDAIESVLSDDQKKLYKEILEERRQNFNRNRMREF